MQLRLPFCVLSALALAPLASAGQPPPTPAQIGAAESVFEFCSRVDRDADPRFDAAARALYAGLNHKQIEKIKLSPDYRNAYGALQSVLRQLSESQARSACEAVEPPRGKDK